MPFSKWNLNLYEENEVNSEIGETTDEELIILAQDGDKSAFNSIYEKYFLGIYRFLTRMTGDSWIGEELAQSTFLKAWQALPSLHDPKKFRSWLYRIATNEKRDYERHSDALPIEEFDQNGFLNQNLDESEPGPEELIEAKEYLEEIIARISPEKCRACFILYCIEGFSILQIVESVGVQESSVRQYISSGRSQCRSWRRKDSISDER